MIYLKGLLRGKALTDVTADEKNQVLDQMINMQPHRRLRRPRKTVWTRIPDVAARRIALAHADFGG